MRPMFRASLIVSLLATSACTQPAAQVDLKGQDSFGRNGSGGSGYASSHTYVAPHSSYASSSSYTPPPIYTNTMPPPGVSNVTNQKASVDSIGISDLSPPPKSSDKGAMNMPADKPKTEIKQASVSNAPINHWTDKPHFSDSASAADDKGGQWTKDDKAVAQSGRLMTAENTVEKTKAAASGHGQAFIWPVSTHKLISGFGPKGAGKANDGINIAAGEGEPVWASADGEVVYVGNELKGYGNMVLIKHAGNKSTTYAHLNRTTVDKYDRVKQGDIIGYVGSTGDVKTSQLHFAIQNGKESVDPTKYLNTKVASN